MSLLNGTGGDDVSDRRWSAIVFALLPPLPPNFVACLLGQVAAFLRATDRERYYGIAAQLEAVCPAVSPSTFLFFGAGICGSLLEDTWQFPLTSISGDLSINTCTDLVDN